MIAKLIVWDHDRPAAVRRLQAALRDYEVAGVQTNLDLLRRVAAHPAFGAADLDTGFLDRDPALLAPEAANTPKMRLTAPRDGTVATVNAEAGALVDDGAELVRFDAA